MKTFWFCDTALKGGKNGEQNIIHFVGTNSA